MNASGPQGAGWLVNEARYRLSEPASAEYQQVISRTRQELATAGCSVLPEFVRSGARQALGSECEAIAEQAYFGVEIVNAYNTNPDPSLPADHPARITMERGNAFVARDSIPADFVIHQLYTSELFRQFVARCFDLPALFELADPLAGLCLNVVRPGMEHPWHFDTNEFTVSMVTQEPQVGGVFEYCPNIRSEQAENLGDVSDVLAGRGAPLIRWLSPRTGDLQLFRGRYSLHRVTQVRGETDRHSAIFAYSEQPGVVGNPTRTRQLFGRVLPEHLAALGRSVRVDKLLD